MAIARLCPLAPGRFFGEQLATADGRVDCRPSFFDDAIRDERKLRIEDPVLQVARAEVVDPTKIPSTVVTMNSHRLQ